MLKNFYVGIKAIIKVNDKVLLMKKTDQDGKEFWDIPGGRIDDNETIIEALNREISEEVPALEKYEIGRLVHAYRLERDLKNGLGLMLLFYQINTGSFEVIISDEHTSYQWFSKDDLDTLSSDIQTYISSGYLEAVQKVLAK